MVDAGPKIKKQTERSESPPDQTSRYTKLIFGFTIIFIRDKVIICNEDNIILACDLDK